MEMRRSSAVVSSPSPSSPAYLSPPVSPRHPSYSSLVPGYLKVPMSTSKSRKVESRTARISGMGHYLLENTFEHDITWRSLIFGSLLGVIVGTQNIYFGILSGSSFGGPITTSLIGFAAMRLISRVIGSKLKFTVHENVILQTTAVTGQSAVFTGGFSTYILAMSPEVAAATGIIGGAAASTYSITYPTALAWLLSVICLGFFMAQPMRRSLIVEHDYPWPTPTATAIVISALHSGGGSEAATKMVAFLLRTMLVSFVWYWWKWLFNAGGHMESWPIFGAAAADPFMWYLDWSTAFIGSGVLISFKSAWSMLAGAITMFGIISPLAWNYRNLWFDEQETDMQGLKSYWFISSLSITVVDSIYQLVKVLVQYLLLLRRQRERLSSSIPEEEEEVAANRDIPTWFWLGGFLLNSILVCLTTPLLFDVPWYLCLLAILTGPVLGYGINLGAALTDIGIVSSIGKFIIIAFGVTLGQQGLGGVTTLLWLAGIGMVSVGSSNDILSDYRTAFMTGTSTRSMFKAQVFGALVACFITPLTYSLFLEAYPITSTGQYQAPNAVALRTLAFLFMGGFKTFLPPHVVWFAVAFGVWALVNNILNDFLPSRYTILLPNSMAFAIGGYIRPAFGINPMIGYLIKFFWKRVDRDHAHLFGPALGGGMIAGEGVAATCVAIALMLGIHPPKAMGVTFGQVPSS